MHACSHWHPAPDMQTAGEAAMHVQASANEKPATAKEALEGSSAQASALTAAGRRGAAMLRPLGRFAQAVQPLLAKGLRDTTLLLLLIWFVNALTYYGLVLLTTTVRGMYSLIRLWCYQHGTDAHACPSCRTPPNLLATNIL